MQSPCGNSGSTKPSGNVVLERIELTSLLRDELIGTQLARKPVELSEPFQAPLDALACADEIRAEAPLRWHAEILAGSWQLRARGGERPRGLSRVFGARRRWPPTSNPLQVARQGRHIQQPGLASFITPCITGDARSLTRSICICLTRYWLCCPASRGNTEAPCALVPWHVTQATIPRPWITLLIQLPPVRGSQDLRRPGAGAWEAK